MNQTEQSTSPNQEIFYFFNFKTNLHKYYKYFCKLNSNLD